MSGNIKQQKIIQAATQLFLQQGYEATRIEDVAAKAGVSKPTVYRFYENKQKLYATFVCERCEHLSSAVFEIESAADDVEKGLHDIAHNFVDLIMSPLPMAMFRTVMAESLRFPELGRILFEAGPKAGAQKLCQYLENAVTRGQLEIDDTEAAAWHFIEMCRGGLFYKLQLQIISEVTQSEKDRIANEAVKTFLRAYRPRSA